MPFLIRCALGYDMDPGARPVILPVIGPRNRAKEYLKSHAMPCYAMPYMSHLFCHHSLRYMSHASALYTASSHSLSFSPFHVPPLPDCID